MINGITPFRLSSKCKHRFRINLYEGAIYEDFVDDIRPPLWRKPRVITIHTGTNDIMDYDFSSFQINLSKTPDLVTELSPSTKIVLSSIILRHDKSNINVKKTRRKEIIKQFCKTNKLLFDRQLKYKVEKNCKWRRNVFIS